MIKKLVKWTFIVLVTLILGVTAAIYIFKDRIIQQVIVEANNYMAVPMEVSKVDIDFFHGFPRVSVAFYDVNLMADDQSVLQAKKIYTLLNPFNLAKGKLDFDVLEIIDANLNIYVNKDNQTNLLRLFKPPEAQNDTIADTLKTNFSLGAVTMKNVNMTYLSDFSGSSYRLTIEQLKGGLLFREGEISSKITSRLHINMVSNRNWSSSIERRVELDLEADYNLETKNLMISNSNIELEDAQATVDGNLVFNEQVDVNLDFSANNISFDLLASFLPKNYQELLKKYDSSGNINYTAEVVGKVTANSLPGISAKLALSNVDLTAKKYNANIKDLEFVTNLHIKDLANLSASTITVNDAKGMLQDKEFGFNINLSNLQNPKYNAKIKGEVGVAWLLALANYERYKSGQGHIKMNLDIISSANDNIPSLNGVFTLEDVSFQWSDSINIGNMSGQVIFSDDAVELASLRLNWLNSDIMISGHIADLIQNVQQPDGQILLRSDIRANYLAVEDIVSLIRQAPEIAPATTEDSISAVSLNEKIDLELVANFKQLDFQRYTGSNVTGEIFIQDNVLEIVDLTGYGMGGIMKINGALKIMPSDEIFIEARALTRGVYLDSLFYTFKNFNQEFIEDVNLKGKLYSDISTSMYFKSNWGFKSEFLTADAKIGIVAGELNDFEPIMALSSYIDDEDDNLSQLRFSDLVNTVKIRNDTLYIPEMSIQTNVRNIALGGYHTLDQHINYQLAVPIINERVDKDEAFGAVQKSSKGSPNLLFRIKGTTTDYKVNYDLLRATGSVLKLLDITKIFKKEEQMPVDSTFLNDEEFDW